jgi:predicted secreted Zn-dependent protease
MQISLRSNSSFLPAAVFGLAAILFALVVVSGAGPACAELRYKTTYRDNPIRGTTPQQLWRYMAGHPIIDEDGPALANITHDHKLSVETERSDGACRVSKVDFTWHFVITLPKAVDHAGMSPAVRSMWREFTVYLKRHEEHHRTIFIGCGEDFLARAAKLTARGPCFGLKGKVKRYIDKQYKVCMAKQRAFDREDKQSVARLALRRAYRK